VTHFLTHYNAATDLWCLPMFSLFPWLHRVSPLTEARLVITCESGRQVIARMNFWAWLTSMATPLDLYKLSPTLTITFMVQQEPKEGRSRRASRRAVPQYRARSSVAAQGGISCSSGTGSARPRRRRKNAAELLIDADLFSEEMSRAVIEKWIVPSVVERMISSISNPSSTPKG
jgi:hypothetical protein